MARFKIATFAKIYSFPIASVYNGKASACLPVNLKQSAFPIYPKFYIKFLP